MYSGKNGKAIIFNQTKKDADELAVSEHMKQDAHVLHGDIPQDKREMVLKVYTNTRFGQTYSLQIFHGYMRNNKLLFLGFCYPRPKAVTVVYIFSTTMGQ